MLFEIIDRANAKHTVNIIEFGDSTIDRSGYQSYLWIYSKKGLGLTTTITQLLISAPNLETANKVFGETIRKSTPSETMRVYDGSAWYVRCEGGMFFPEYPTALMISRS